MKKYLLDGKKFGIAKGHLKAEYESGKAWTLFNFSTNKDRYYVETSLSEDFSAGAQKP